MTNSDGEQLTRKRLVELLLQYGLRGGNEDERLDPVVALVNQSLRWRFS
jgi:hypothetical protein